MADGAGDDRVRQAQATRPKMGFSPLGRVLFAILVGTIGAVVFVRFGLPLPWYLGALTFCLIASVAGLPVERPKRVSGPLRAVLGVAVGSAFTPALLERMGSMLVSLLLLVPFMVLIMLASMAFYRHVAGFDRPTAFFSAVPGGLADMTAMAEEAGANQRAVILVQATRIVLIVFFVPLWLKWHDGLSATTPFASRVRLMEVTLVDGATLVVMGIVGWWGALRLGIAGASIVGPMIVSGFAHALGLTTAAVPLELLVVAQIGVGVLLGCQFRGLTLREFTRWVVWGLINAVALLGLTLVMVQMVTGLTGADPVSVLMAFAPGGQTELNLLAFVLGVDVAYVALHHLARLAIVIVGAQLVLRSQPHWRRP